MSDMVAASPTNCCSRCRGKLFLCDSDSTGSECGDSSASSTPCSCSDEMEQAKIGIFDGSTLDAFLNGPAVEEVEVGTCGLAIPGLPCPVASAVSLSSFGEDQSPVPARVVSAASAGSAIPTQDKDWMSASSDLKSARGFEELSFASTLMDARVFTHMGGPQAPFPWAQGNSLELYEELGCTQPGATYTAIWLTMKNTSLLYTGEVKDRSLVERVVAGNFLKDRMKLLVRPVQVRLPFPAKGPKDAETVANFFGASACSFSRNRTPCGAEVLSIQVDIFSKWILRMALQKAAFRVGNSVDMMLVDWNERLIFGSMRLTVTDSFLRIAQ